MGELARIVVFAGDLSYPTCKNVIAIDRALPGLSWLVLVHTPPRRAAHMVRRQWRGLRRNGWRQVPALAGALQRQLSARTPLPDVADAPGFESTASHLRSLKHVAIQEVADMHADAVLTRVAAFAPDLGISLGAPILQPSLYALPRLGTLNLHKGKLPEYRGMPPVFWELWNGEASVGCTVHWIEEGLDTGPIAAATSLAVEKYSTVKGLLARLDEVGIDLVRDVVVKLAAGKSRRVAQRPGGSVYRRPSLAQVAHLEHRLAQRLPPQPALAKRLAKHWIRKGAFTVGMAAIPWAAQPRATVLLYHRVTDSVRDNLTTGIEQFDRQMSLLRRYFHVMALPDLLAQAAIPKTGRPVVCVTFDDGYLDNYINAFPILSRHQIPAAFFVSTGFIGTRRRFAHDIRRGNPLIALMSWDHLREMHAAGFTIGSHTVNHIDCAAESEQRVRRELHESMDSLARELHLDQVIFSYPYGGRQHITPERLEWVRQVGYTGCVSAYGGTNVGTLDRFNVLRRGIHWEFGDASFLYTAAGL